MEKEKLIKKYLRYVKTHRKVSKSTLRNYKSVLKEFIKYPITEEGIEEYLESISTQALKTQERKIIIIRSYLKYLYEKKYIKEKLHEDLKTPRYSTLPKWLTPKEVKEVLKHALSPYNYIFEFIYKTGVRIGELENLSPEDISEEKDGTYKIRIKGKGRKERVLKVKENIINLLYKAGFPNLPHRRQIQKEAQKISKEIGKKVTPHILRHSFAIRLLSEGKPITLVQALLGHSKLDTTAIYTKIESDMVTLE